MYLYDAHIHDGGQRRDMRHCSGDQTWNLDLKTCQHDISFCKNVKQAWLNLNTCESRGVQYRGQMQHRVGGGRMRSGCSGSEG